MKNKKKSSPTGFTLGSDRMCLQLNVLDRNLPNLVSALKREFCLTDYKFNNEILLVERCQCVVMLHYIEII